MSSAPATNVAAIYQIYSHNAPVVYISSTQRELAAVYKKFKNDFKQWKLDDESQKYHPSFEVFAKGNSDICVITEYEFSDIDDLRDKEESIIAEFEHCVNSKSYPKTKDQMRIDCPCGGHYCNNKGAEKVHEKTKKHLQYIAKIEEEERAKDEVADLQDEVRAQRDIHLWSMSEQESDYSSDEE